MNLIGMLPERGVEDPEAVQEAGWAERVYSYQRSQPFAVQQVTTEEGTSTYDYDANGNMTARVENGVSWTHTYNAENRLASMTNGVTTWLFSYDGDGTLVGQLVTDGATATHTAFFMGGGYEVISDGVTETVRKYYALAGSTFGMSDNGVMKYLISDHLGSTVAITDNTGILLAETRYMPFGEPRADMGSLAGTDKTYTGQRDVPDTGLMDYKARMYSPYFNRCSFPEADELACQLDEKELSVYEKFKSEFVRDAIRQKWNLDLNSEQSEAISKTSPNLLLTARAGSGKTAVIAAKTAFLIEYENVHPDHIMVMTFNSIAAGEIRNRIRQRFLQPDFENARTFHSLASQLVQPEEDILCDDKEDNSTQKKTLFIQDLLKTELKNQDFIEPVYEFFRKEMREIERTEFSLDDENYLDFRRNMLQVTLGGEKVKSMGEKFIADYLFEHGISYIYEKVWFWGSQIYHPDFSICDRKRQFVLEHWGIDEFDRKKRVPIEWNQSWDEYFTEMQEKRQYWANKKEPVVLIETSIADLRGGREKFEKILQQRLANAGISRPQLTRQELLNKIKERNYIITKLAMLFTQFIQKAKQQMRRAQDVQDLLHEYHPKDVREATFIDLACRIYQAYEKALVQRKKIDFDDLLIRAIGKIYESKGECTIRLGLRKNRPVKMNSLRWILIDEYQDFSRLFFELIKAIRTYNPHVRLFCVGDDWQAINGYAGSDLCYFHGFSSWLDKSGVVTLSTNYRSCANIVDAGNQLMRGYGVPAQALPGRIGGDVFVKYMDDSREDTGYVENTSMENDEGERFNIPEKSSRGTEAKSYKVVASRYLRRCFEIITMPKYAGKTVAILNRTNWIDGVRLGEFKQHLVDCFSPADLQMFPNLGKMIDIQTAHKYKGLQADLVIILNVTDGSFPMIHPDNALFEIFGKKLEDTLAEEMRLFYVALTRAATSLYIITEKNRKSSFLNRLDVYNNKKSDLIFRRLSEIRSGHQRVKEMNQLHAQT